MLTETEISTANHWIKSNVGSLDSVSLIGVGPGSKWASKIWPEENYAKVGRRLFSNDTHAYPIVFGGPTDQALGDRLLRTWGRGANAAGKLSPRQAAAALSRCELYLGNDTGTMHLAASVGTRCVAIMSAQDWPGRWYPYGEHHVVLRTNVPCEGCQLKVCEREALRCLTSITVEEVVSACCQILSAKPQYHWI
jgi:ADP-heptose:LPS heptosyltransferase